MNIFLLREAVASVALSHEEGHDCDVCKAADGDEEAFQRVMLSIHDFEQAHIYEDPANRKRTGDSVRRRRPEV